MSTNSDKLWQGMAKKRAFIAKKTLTISILEPINENLEQKHFLQLLQKNIYRELDNLN